MSDVKGQERLKEMYEEQKDRPIINQSIRICDYCGKYHWKYDQCPKIIQDSDKMNKGRKYDDGKTEWHKAPWEFFEKVVESITKNPDFRWDLLPFEPIEKIVEILTYGAKKYEPNNWQNNASYKYFSALIRHILADYVKKEDYDQESGLLHTSHMCCNTMFLSWQKLRDIKEKEK